MIKLFGPDRQLLGYEDQEWAVWVSGVNDVLPQPDLITALVTAAEQNAALCGGYDGHPFTPVAYAVVLHHGYAWTQSVEHQAGRDCGMRDCTDCGASDDGVHVSVTRYEVSVLPEGDINRPVYTINVEARGRDCWAVVHHRQCLNTKGEWSWESIPSERGAAWLAEHRFDLNTALTLARQAAPRLVVNGHTATEWLKRTQTDAT
ncbi:hypothetical protein DF268_08700 [Streptomyces sp. V2]|uniref:hypothetical protein n=1 Tax=Streptomyces sp. V2 TaxID=1424099 RepID=UPI000D670290|nr:hypothetical protein [Streptomyces sp. V2]PWG13934.1 hypothetical protein DF268_08700 [Streptomyces sp. V2]